MLMKLTPIARAPEPTYPTAGSRLARGLARAAAATATVMLLSSPALAEDEVRMAGDIAVVEPPPKPVPPPTYQAPIVVTPTPVKPPVDARLPGRIAPIAPRQ